MDSSQLVRKESNMETVHINQKQPAARWHLSEACLERWRCEGIGPVFLKIRGRVLYHMVDNEAYEESCLATSTKVIVMMRPSQLPESRGMLDIQSIPKMSPPRSILAWQCA